MDRLIFRRDVACCSTLSMRAAPVAGKAAGLAFPGEVPGMDGALQIFLRPAASSAPPERAACRAGGGTGAASAAPALHRTARRPSAGLSGCGSLWPPALPGALSALFDGLRPFLWLSVRMDSPAYEPFRLPAHLLHGGRAGMLYLIYRLDVGWRVLPGRFRSASSLRSLAVIMRRTTRWGRPPRLPLI